MDTHSDAFDAQPIIPPDLREKPRRPVNSNVRLANGPLRLIPLDTTTI